MNGQGCLAADRRMTRLKCLDGIMQTLPTLLHTQSCPPLVPSYVDVVRFPHPLKKPPAIAGAAAFGESPAELAAGGVLAGSPTDSEVLLRGTPGVFIGPLRIFLRVSNFCFVSSSSCFATASAVFELTSSRRSASFVAGSWFVVEKHTLRVETARSLVEGGSIRLAQLELAQPALDCGHAVVGRLLAYGRGRRIEVGR